MRVMEELTSLSKLHAPAGNGEILAVPKLDEAENTLADNRALSRGYDVDFGGASYRELADLGRRELTNLALRYTRSYRDVPTVGPATDRATFVAGHQPELFHPGVWIKNFALSALAKRHDGVAVNLVIDSDITKSSAIRIPVGDQDNPAVTHLAFDSASERMPYEERRISNRVTFSQFGNEVSRRMRRWVQDPLIEELWPLAISRADVEPNLGRCLAQSRHQLEASYEGTSLELPQSIICRSESFCRFAAHILANADRFRSVHNAALYEYRRVHRIRSHSHPVPELAVKDGWIEVPFWLWSKNQPRRRRVFTRRQHGEFIVSDLASLEFRVPARSTGELADAAARLMELPETVKFRSRALINTLFARLILADVFVHGIGGAKYDLLTDSLISGFLGLEPPAYVVLSATLKLPIDHDDVTDADTHQIRHRLRELTFHPEVYASLGDGETNGELAYWANHKRRWIESQVSPQNFRKRWIEIRRANEAMQPSVQGERDRLLNEEKRLSQAAKAEKIFGSREYAFCIHSRRDIASLINRVQQSA